MQVGVAIEFLSGGCLTHRTCLYGAVPVAHFLSMIPLSFSLVS